MAVSKSSSSSVSRSPRPAATTAKRSAPKSSSPSKAGRGTTKTSNPSKTQSTHRVQSSTAVQSKAKTTEVGATGRAGDSFQASAELQEERARGTQAAAQAGNHNALMAGIMANYGESKPSSEVGAISSTTRPNGEPLSAEGQKRADEAVKVQDKVEDKAVQGTANQTPSDQTVQALRQQVGDPPKLDNVLTVHGLFADESTFKTMTDYWTSTGANQLGGTIKGQDLAGMSMDQIKAIKDPAELSKRLGLNHQGNIYNMQFSGNSNASSQNREELAKAVQVVSQLRGGGNVDLVAHSKGGLDSRNLLDSGQGDKVRSLTMLGTPNKGSSVADLATSGAGSLGAGFLEGNRATPGRPALGELSKNSTFTQQLNERFQQQISRLTGGALAIQGSTPLGGDGVVSHDSASVPGAINKTAWGSTHMDMGTGLGITNSPSVIREVSQFLSGGQMTPGQDLYDGMGGRALSAVSNGYDATANAVGNAASAVGNTAAQGWEGAKYYGNQGWEGTKHYANQGWEGAKHYGNQAYEGTVNGATRAYDATVSGAGQAYDAVTTAASDAWSYLFK